MPESWKYQPHEKYLPRNHSALSSAYGQSLRIWTAGYMTALCERFRESSRYLMLFWKHCSVLSRTAAFALIAAALLGVLVLAGVIKAIVFWSILFAWAVAVLWIARAKPVRALTVTFRSVFIGIIGVLLAIAGNSFGHWALNANNREKATEHMASDKNAERKGEEPRKEPSKIEDTPIKKQAEVSTLLTHSNKKGNHHPPEDKPKDEGKLQTELDTNSNKFPSDANARLVTGVEGALAEYNYAKKRLASDPDKLNLYDLYLTDFEPSEVKHSRTIGLNFPQQEIRLGATVVWQVETGTEFVMFYIPYNKITDQLCLYLRGQYKRLLEEAQLFGVEKKLPGESEQVTAKGLVFSNRIFIYHETYLSPEQTILVRNFYAADGITLSLRSGDYLENRKLEAKVKMLEKNGRN